jgi:phage-related protein
MFVVPFDSPKFVAEPRTVWLSSVRDAINLDERHHCIVINKSDIPDADRRVQEADLHKFDPEK